MTNKIIFLATLIAYSFIISQSLIYVLSLKHVQMNLNAVSYTQVRQLTDRSMRSSFKYVIYSALFLNVVLVIMNIKNPGSLVFIASAVSLLALIIDIMLTLKGNLPLNDIINSWTPDHIPADWTEIRAKWFEIFQYRQIVSVIGFLGLLVAAVFGNK